MRRWRRARGTSLIEVMISLAVVLVGMLALFKTLGSSLSGSMTASRLTQAQQRAVLVMEAIRVAPKPALNCLVGSASADWDGCETLCKSNLININASATIDSCIYKNLSKNSRGNSPTIDIATDPNSQRYDVVTSLPSGLPASQVTAQGNNIPASLYEAQIVVGWRDDNTNASSNPDHYVVLRSGVFQP